ncbi:MAG: Serine/threonine protein kinase, partial [Frankiales bacterium]|nr:Serine/threonine protein kinase [Frankiales bacterium]
MTGMALRPRTARSGHLLRAAIAAVVLAACTRLAVDGLPPGEEGAFRLVNDVPLPVLLVWPVMQLGNVLAVPSAALVAAALRRWRLSVELLVAGGASYLLAKVVKDEVDRGRPGELLDDVHLRGAGDAGRGFVSGHAAVAAALAVAALPHLGP